MKIIKKTVTKQIVDYFIELIRKGYYKSGDKLPSQDELAKELEVSRVSIREAMINLQCKGIIDMKQGEGTFIKNNNLKNIINRTVNNSLLSINDKNNLIYLLEVRRIVEQHTIELAIIRSNKEELFILKNIIIEMHKCKDRKSFLDRDLEFHLQIARLSKNPILFYLLETIRYNFWDELIEVMEIPGVKEKAIKYHHLIYNALESKDREKAIKLMLDHLKEPEKIILKQIKNKQ